MQTPTYPVEPRIEESSRSGVSWSAIIAGAVATAALSLILFVFGSGVGLAAVSPWHRSEMAAAGFTVTAAIWLVAVQWVSAGIGGYLTGRLRCKWVGIHDHEVFFRDTAHGFLAWALSTVAGALLLVSAASHMASGAAHMRTMNVTVSPAQAASAPGNNSDPLGYYVDSLFRAPAAANAPATQERQDVRGEADRILATNLKQGGDVSDTDRSYLAQLVAARTGLSADDAAKRVNDVLAREKDDEAKAKQMLDGARKAMATVSIYSFLSLLIGAFIASVSAALGGRARDLPYPRP